MSVERSLALALLLPLGLHAEPKLMGGAHNLPRNLVSTAGGLSTGAGFRLNCAVAETVGTATGAGFAMDPGLLPLIAQPGSVTAIVSVSKATGTLELSWVSPGLDGFLGDIAAGFYRIDTSSDPLHAFDPTVFMTEFATAVTPGTTSFYTLTGLLANTTYYSRVYLADSRKSVSETSAASAESSLARVPEAPAFTGVFATSVTISWVLPAGAAEGFRLEASSINFLGYGAVATTQTPSGTAVTLTVTGLFSDTTYFFNLGSLNWQSDVNFNTVLTTRTLPGAIPPIFNLALTADSLARRLTLTWSNPAFNNPAGVTILVSTNPIAAVLADGTPYPPGTAFEDGALVKSSAAVSIYLETSLTLDVTGYFSLYSRDTSNLYSIAVSTAFVLDLPPMAPAGLQGRLSADATAFLLNWAEITSNLDGASFAVPLIPTSWELQRYDVYRATGIVRANWVYVGSAAASALSYSAAVPAPETVYYYRVVSRDAFPGGGADSAMAIDTLGDLWAVHPDRVSRLKIPASMAGVIQPAGNPYGRSLLVRAEDRPQDLGGRIVKSVMLGPVISPTNAPAVLPAAAAGYAVALRYETAGGFIVPSSGGQPPAGGTAAANAPESLLAYYVSGDNAAKVFGHVDTSEQEVALKSGLLGNYQIRTVARTLAFDFDLGGVSNRALTPNGDGLNDTIVFTFNNPKVSAFSGKMFDLRGRFVSDMRAGPIADSSLLWDGKAGGVVVPRGVYLYEIQAEGRTFNGTVVVIR